MFKTIYPIHRGDVTVRTVTTIQYNIRENNRKVQKVERKTTASV
jgi:hypothetical protein